METIGDIRQLPGLGEDTIHIWGIHVPGVLDRLDVLHAVLCEKEREKAARFHRAADRHASIAARGALRILLSGYTGIPAAGVGFHYSETGKPHVADSNVDFNVSHSGDWVVLAFGRNRNIGVDVERIKRDMEVLPIASRYFTPEEAALIENAEDRHTMFFQLWARKEAYVKACGSALFRELGSFAVPIVGNELPDLGIKDGWIFQRLDAKRGFLQESNDQREWQPGSDYAAAAVTDKPLASVPCYDFGGLKWDS